jgi:hypothetical protein
MMRMTLMSDVLCKNVSTNAVFTQAHEQGWAAARLVDRELQFSTATGFQDALQSGFFFIEQPMPQISLEAGDGFARSFYLKSSDDKKLDYRELNADQIGSYQGFYARTEDQTEQFFLEAKNWERYYPKPVKEQAVEMRDFAIAILNGVLERLPIPPHLFAKATGGAMTVQGTHTLTFNHFRPDVRRRGLNVHKDSGWVTLLRSPWPGLEVDVGGRWRAINPIDNSFIVNFGCAFEILTRALPMPVKAAAHRVVSQQRRHDDEDRFSYALFVDSSLSRDVTEGLFEASERGELEFVCNFNNFLEAILNNTYDRDGKGLY